MSKNKTIRHYFKMLVESISGKMKKGEIEVREEKYWLWLVQNASGVQLWPYLLNECGVSTEAEKMTASRDLLISKYDGPFNSRGERCKII